MKPLRNKSFRFGIFCDNVSAMSDSVLHWNTLHANPRFRPVYPNEDVVRFLLATRAQLKPDSRRRLLDIGTGAGRHMRLAAELEFSPIGIDISHTGLRHARERLQNNGATYGLALASMTALPFAEQSFDVVVSYGCFNYGYARDMKRAISEVRRILTTNGRSFIVLRTTRDYRYGKGRELESGTFQLDIADTNELGTIQHFLTEENICEYFGDFSSVSFERVESTFCGRTRVNSDWLITAEK